MSTVWKIYFLCGVLLVVVSLLVWLIKAVAGMNQSGSPKRLIAPIEIHEINGEEKESIAMASMLKARLDYLVRVLKQADGIFRRDPLKELQEGLERAPQIPAVFTHPAGESANLWVGEETRLLKSLDIEMKVAGVDVGGMIARFTNSFQQDDAIHIGIIKHSAQKAVLFSSDIADGEVSLWKEWGDEGEFAMMDYVAHARLRARFAAVYEGYDLDDVPVEDFQRLVKALIQVVQYDQQKAAGDSYKAALDDLKQLSLRPIWKDWPLLYEGLAWVAARSQDWPACLAALQRALTLARKGPADKDHSDGLEKRIAIIQERLTPQETPAVAANNAEPTAQVAAVKKTFSNRRQFLRNSIGLTEEMRTSGEARILMIGGAPAHMPSTTKSFRFPNLEEAHLSGKDEFYAEYQANLLQIYGSVLVHCEVTFFPIKSLSDGAFVDRDLLEVWSRAVAAHQKSGKKSSVFHCSLGYQKVSLYGALHNAVREAREAGMISVLSGGNEGQDWQSNELAKDALVIGGLDEAGKPLKTWSSGKELLWVPGKNLPGVRTMEGTGPASALAAAAVAQIIAECPDKSADEIINAVKQSATVAENEVHVVNVAAAIKKLRTG